MQLIFPVPSAAVWRNVRGLLAAQFELGDPLTTAGTRTFYDTFDWRLYVANEVLAIEATESVRRLYWSSLDSEAFQVELQLESVPRFAQDLVPGPVQQRLEQRIENRALLPKATLKFKTQLFAVLGSDAKTLSRLAMEEYSLVGVEGGSAVTRRLQARLVGLKGYEKVFEKLRECLAEGLNAEPCADTIYTWAVTGSGNTPGSYSSKFSIKVQPELPAELVVKQICAELLNVIRANEAGVRAALDPEFLHDYRVAIRRMRSVLQQIKDVFPSTVVAYYSEEFAWLGQVTGPARDFDVYLSNFSGYQSSLPEEMREALEPLRTVLKQHQQASQAELVKAIDSSRYRRLISRLERFLASPKRHKVPKNAGRPIIEVAVKRLRRLYRRICTEGLAIAPESKPDALHDLRKACKKLRYLLEFFSSLFPQREVQKNTRVLKQLQETLGEFQDMAVQSDVLQRFALAFEGQRIASSTLLAMGMLVAHLRTQQDLARHRFAADFQHFASAANQARWLDMLDTDLVPET